MTDQATLFESWPTQGRFRKDGPSTSRRSGESMCGMHLRGQQVQVLVGLVLFHRRLCMGANAWEVSCQLVERGVRAPAINACGSRFDELAEMGMVRLAAGERPGETGRPQKVYVPTADGTAWATAWLNAHPDGLAA